MDHWHEVVGDPTLADTILDRLIHSAHKINLKGESIIKKYSALTKEEQMRIPEHSAHLLRFMTPTHSKA